MRVATGTRYTPSTGVMISRVMKGEWRHIDANDGQSRVVGPLYKSKQEILRDHVDYLLRAGWLRLSIPMPEPVFEVAIDFGAYGWSMENTEIGIKIFENSKDTARQCFAEAVAREFDGAVTIIPS